MIPDKNQFYSIKAKHSNKVAEVFRGDTGDNVNIQQYSWDGGNNKKWMFVPLNDNNYAIVCKHSGKVFEVFRGDSGDNVNIQQYHWNGGENQQWFLHDSTDGYNEIQARHSGKVAEVFRGETGDHVNIQQYSRNGGDNQKWLLDAVESFNLPSIQTHPVPEVPKYETINDILPEQTEKVVTHYALAPCIAVVDPYYNDQQKIQTGNHYYLYVREQYWLKVTDHTLSPGETHEYTQVSGIKDTDANTVINTVSHTYGADAGLSFKSDSLSLGMSYQYSQELQIHRTQVSEELTVKQEVLTKVNNEDFTVAWTKYILVNNFYIQRADGTIVNEPWSMTDPSTTRSVSYPEGAKLSDV
ncbi:RICIN domain-containing protein (plasmid) [Bacillus tropicus]|uniref:RICIN domain-containing protein n=1 Tax=Bacillus tropicus TaxID=2026188 RepID=UPI0020034101|nr:RICIN domain-containing protein [Bacillus tropicus]UOK49326.1 RICIN domain-containing protein [Bacillus tropicus]